jgi:type II secretory pathway pseudopilin PulG
MRSRHFGFSILDFGFEGRKRRSGISLLEVVIALAIFLGATTVIGQLVATGSQAAIGAQLKAEAARRCETVMSEAIAGVIPLEPTGEIAFEDDPLWTWNLDVKEAPVADMLLIKARVTRQIRAGQPPATMELSRWIRDPALWTQSTVESTSSSGGTP